MPCLADVRNRYSVSYLAYERENQYVFRDIALKSLAEAGLRPESGPGSSPPQLLEIGCATGALLERFSRAGWHTTGVDRKSVV